MREVSGLPTTIACQGCGNIQGNKLIYFNEGTSYPNGNSWEDKEIVCGKCGKCGKYSLINEFWEG